MANRNGERGDESLATYPGTGVIQMNSLGWNDLGQIPLECWGIDPEDPYPDHDAVPNFNDPERTWFIPIEDFTEDDLDRESDKGHSYQEYLDAGEKLAKMLGMELSQHGVPAVIAAYLEDRMDGVVCEFLRGDETMQTVAYEFLGKLYYCLSRQENRDCWPEVSEKAEKKFLAACRRKLTPLHRRFGIALCGEARLNRLLAV